MKTPNNQDNLCYIPEVPLVVVISGPSGVGKDTILNQMKQNNAPFTFITTVTTRRKRENEKDGVDYHFISETEFQELLASDGLLEWAKVYGNYYGVPKQPVRETLAQGKDIIIKVDIQGVANIKKILPEAVFIFIMPPSREELTTRLTQRCTENAADLSLRIKTAENELVEARKFDYIVVNPCDGVEQAINTIMSIVAAEKCRANPRKITL